MGERPATGWRGAVYGASGGLVNPGVGEAESTHNALLQRIRRPLRGGLEIAVTSLKGGVGKTTVAACLGLTLAEFRGDRTVALDANPDAGTLADRLTGEVDLTLRQMLTNLDSIASLPDVSRYTSEAGRLNVIASEQDPASSEAFHRDEYQRICEVLVRYYDILITDSGTGMVHSAMEGTLARADALVVVGSPTVDGSSRASKTLDWLNAHDYGQLAADAVVVLCRDRVSEQIDGERIRAHFESRCRAVVEIPFDPHLAVGGRIDLGAVREPVRDAYLELGALLIEAHASPATAAQPDMFAFEPPVRPPEPFAAPEPEAIGPVETGLNPRRRRATRGRGSLVATAVIVFSMLVGLGSGVAILAQPRDEAAPAQAAAPPPPAPAPAPPPPPAPAPPPPPPPAQPAPPPAQPPAEPAPPPAPGAKPAEPRTDTPAELRNETDVVASVPVPSLGPPVPVGSTPGYVAVSPNGRLAYIANREAKTVNVVDTSINKVTATIPIGAGPPQFLTFAPNGRRVYLSIYDQERTVLRIGVLDTTTNKIITTVPVRTRPYVAAITPDGRELYVPNHDSGTISVLNTASNKIVKEIKVPPNPRCIEFSRDGTRAYIANQESNLISVLDTATDEVIAQIPVQNSPHSVAVHPSQPLVANVNYDSNSVSMIDTNQNAVVATVPVGKNPQDITWAADGRFAYVANVGDGTVSVIDNETRRVTATIPTGPSPTSIAVLPTGRRGYVTNLDNGTLSVLNLGG